MARYYFDIQDGTTLVRDDEGSAFDDPDAAVQAAAVRRLRLERAGW
jgi:hypothetical protein